MVVGPGPLGLGLQGGGPAVGAGPLGPPRGLPGPPRGLSGPKSSDAQGLPGPPRGLPGLKSSDAQGLPGLKSSDAQGLPGLKPWVMIRIIRSGAERLFLKVD